MKAGTTHMNRFVRDIPALKNAYHTNFLWSSADALDDV